MSDVLSFAEESQTTQRRRADWNVLIVDDEQEVHTVTTLALEDFRFAGRALHFLHAHSAAEAKVILREHNDIAIVLLDVVMETDQAGLDVVEYVRGELKNNFLRIILRTGQPGQAPELDVITRFDINDYKHKTELTRERLFTTVYTALSTYRDLVALEGNRKGLRKVIDATAELFTVNSMDHLAQGVLEQLTALLFLEEDAVVLEAVAGVSTEKVDKGLRVVAATGTYSAAIGKQAAAGLPPHVVERLVKACAAEAPIFGADYFATAEQCGGSGQWLFYVGSDVPIKAPDQELIKLFCKNVALARELMQRSA